ncbi:MAG TPA: hypothetical protein PKM51_05700 [Chitinophagales bacterium]|nr:hypothetical protein [Chitinophagales bacterium]HNM32223.1 hypothetical protein [Chitinophagales bacterium]
MPYKYDGLFSPFPDICQSNEFCVGSALSKENVFSFLVFLLNPSVKKKRASYCDKKR